jgi:hypothetical protein
MICQMIVAVILEIRLVTYLLDVVVRKSAAILELLAGEDQALLVWRNAFLVYALRLVMLGL